MAHIATIKILIDDQDEARVIEGLNEMLQTAASPIDEAEPFQRIVDWEIEAANPAHIELDDSIANEAYEKGDFQRDWVLFSASEASANGDGAGYWSNSFGWTTLDLATKFDGQHAEKPLTAGEDALWMLAPYQYDQVGVNHG
jgi:hypothetical protein